MAVLAMLVHHHLLVLIQLIPLAVEVELLLLEEMDTQVVVLEEQVVMEHQIQLQDLLLRMLVEVVVE
jgi:hypothetical protein